jgi:hypothetical protein
MNPALRHSIMLFLLLMGGAAAMAQETVRTTQTVGFAVNPTAKLWLQDRFAPKETKAELSVTKVTVFLDYLSNNPLRESSSPRTRNPHLDTRAIHSTDLKSILRSKSHLLTIAN